MNVTVIDESSRKVLGWYEMRDGVKQLIRPVRGRSGIQQLVYDIVPSNDGFRVYVESEAIDWLRKSEGFTEKPGAVQ